jgi:hypothetical protein
LNSADSNTVDQSNASARGDLVGRDKWEINQYAAPAANPLGVLLEKLKAEVESDQQAKECLAELEQYHQRSAHDGIEGLQAKLERAGRADELEWALKQKEKFVKLLTEWSLYASAQELFVYLLGRADYEFTVFIRPKLEEIAAEEINEMFKTRIVEPTVAGCAGAVVSISHPVAMGMIYWLAEQCFVRWHK